MSEPDSKPEALHAPHDALFRFVFGQSEQAAGLLQTILPAEITAYLDFGTLRRENASYVEEELGQFCSDLLFSGNLAGRPALIYCLFEHQSTQAQLMPFRMFGYELDVLRDYVRKHPGATRLPAVLPVVVYHDDTAWTAPRTMHELRDVPADFLAKFGRHLGELEMILFDISAISDEQLRSFHRLTALGRLALLCLSRARSSKDIVGEILRFLDVANAVLGSDNGVAAMCAILRYTSAVAEVPRERMRELIRQLGPRGEEAFMTLEQVIKAEGKAEGRAEGKADTLIRLLTLKFGPVPEPTVQRILAARIDELDRWLERVLTAISLDAVFEG